MKYVFRVTEGKLLGHIISKEGMKIDLERIQAIKKIPLLINKKDLQSFFGKVNFLCIFVTNFAEIIFPLSKMMKQNANFKWDKEGKISFEEIK